MLHPTLWRTCRILLGETRLALLRLVVNTPNQTVSDLAGQQDISLPRASQELRRLQSRGLIQAARQNQNVLYRPVPDPLVSSAAPLLAAMQESFRLHPAADDGQLVRIATGFSHVRRLVIVRLLLPGPLSTLALEKQAGMSRDAVNRHVQTLFLAGVVRRNGRQIEIVHSGHPLAECLLGLLTEPPLST